MTSTNKENLDIERAQADAMADSELAQHLQRIWDEGDFPDAEWPGGGKEAAYAEIASRIFSEEDFRRASAARGGKLRLVRKAMRIAAAIMLPALLFASIYFYRQASTGIDCSTVVSTARGETATVTLPDGSEVKINCGSSLAYNPYAFAKGERHVELQGEAFFSVKSDPSRPFSVGAGQASVSVLGTKFNVQSYPGQADITVLLTEGAVEMHCQGIAQAIRLKPWQKATFDKASGTAEVASVDSRDAGIAWVNNEMAFSGVPLEEVVLAIEMRYGVEFDRNALRALPGDGFTGTLPADDLSTALGIIEDVYGIAFTISGRQIIIN